MEVCFTNEYKNEIDKLTSVWLFAFFLIEQIKPVNNL